MTTALLDLRTLLASGIALSVFFSTNLFGIDPSSPAPKPWQDFNVIDIHAHIGTFRGYDLSLATLLANMDRFGVRMVLISNIDGAEIPSVTGNLDETHANQETADVVKKHTDQLRGLAWTRPEDGTPASVEPFLKETKPFRVFVGMKFHPDMNHFAADDKRVDGYLDLCAKYQIPAVFHCGGEGANSEPKKIYAAARRHPTIPVILYHMGFGGSHDAAIASVSESIKKKDARLYLETSQADPQAVLKAIRAVGSDHVLFGTDATYFGTLHYDRYTALVNLLKKELSAEDFARVMHGNAEKLFDVKLSKAAGK